MESVTIKLPPQVITQLETLARDEDVSIGQIVRRAVERDLSRRNELCTPPRTAETLLAPIRVRATALFLEAKSWSQLKLALIDEGYTLREAGGGLALHDAVSGRFLCRTSEIGFGYPTLMRRLKGPFPGHSHTALLDQIRKMPVAYSRRGA